MSAPYEGDSTKKSDVPGLKGTNTVGGDGI
jgi:hypothetical protein